MSAQHVTLGDQGEQEEKQKKIKIKKLNSIHKH